MNRIKIQRFAHMEADKKLNFYVQQALLPGLCAIGNTVFMIQYNRTAHLDSLVSSGQASASIPPPVISHCLLTGYWP